MSRNNRNNKKQQHLKQTTEASKLLVSDGDYDLAVIGGGASGLACALACAQEAQRLSFSPLRIVVLEAKKRLGTSILRSGNGRCNFSNAHVVAEKYWNAGFVSEVFSNLKQNAGCNRVDDNPVLRWFEALGLVWKEAPNSGGLLYPYSNKAFSVLEVLQGALEECQVEIHTNSQVTSLEKVGQKFCLGVDQASVYAKKVVFAAGGSCNKNLLANFLGVSDASISSKPVLGPLRTTFPQGVVSKRLDGIRMQVCMSIPGRAFAEEGEVLFREYGISGIVTFNASRYAQPEDVLLLDLVPDISHDDVQTMLEKRLKILGSSQERLFKGFLLPQISQAVFCAAGITTERSTETSANANAQKRDKHKPYKPLQARDITALARTLKAFPLTVVGIADERQCQVNRGGIHVGSINSETLETRCAPGLYIIGEALDVDGPCGGYNLHWAWATGLLSGLSIARSIAGDFQ